jgi:hypothetical protein
MTANLANVNAVLQNLCMFLCARWDFLPNGNNLQQLPALSLRPFYPQTPTRGNRFLTKHHCLIIRVTGGVSVTLSLSPPPPPLLGP